jgi:hypothetical protein
MPIQSELFHSPTPKSQIQLFKWHLRTVADFDPPFSCMYNGDEDPVIAVKASGKTKM